jgi:hypothetical protein
MIMDNGFTSKTLQKEAAVVYWGPGGNKSNNGNLSDYT